MRKLLLLAAALGVLVPLSGVTTASAADAATPFVAAGSFAADAFSGPQRVAVEHATGRVFVADRANDRVVVYEPTSSGGTRVAEFGGGEIDDPVGIAIDQSDGSVYVADSGNHRIARYLSDGSPTPSYSADTGYTSPVASDVGSFAVSIALDPTNDDLLIADASDNRVKRFDGAGVLQGSFDGAASTAGAFTGLLDIAVDSTGRVVVVDSTGDIVSGFATSRVVRFAGDGTNPVDIGALEAPSAVTVIPGTDQIAVAFNQNSYLFSTPLSVAVFDPDGSVVSTTELPAATLYGVVTGLAAAADTFHRLYVATDRVGGGIFGAVGIQRLALDLRPTVTVDEAADVGPRSATVAGTVNPEGAPTTWQIEYRRSGETGWQAAASAPADAGSGSTAAPVSADLGDLRPNTDYEWRIVARNTLLTTTVDGTAFHTDVSAPRVTTLPASELKSSSVRLNGIVDPYGRPTTYYVEYGYDTGYGTSIPAGRDGDAGSAAKPTRYSKVIDNLVPGRPVHHRFVATNATGTTYGQDMVAVPVQAERRYELVSPPDKNGAEPNKLATFKARADGDRVMFESTGSFADPAGALVFNGYLARRSGDGWLTQGLAVPQFNGSGIAAVTTAEASHDLRTSFAISARALTPDAPPENDSDANMYLQDNDTGALTYIASGVYSDISNSSGSVLIGASDDFRHLLFRAPLTNAPGDHSGVTNGLFEFADGRLRLVARKNDGTPFASSDSPATNRREPLNHAISSDGRRIYFTADPGTELVPTSALWLREDGERTIAVSDSQRADAPGLASANFGGASADGGVVYFTSYAPLAENSEIFDPDDAPFRLYRWTRATNELTQVVGAVEPNSGATYAQVLRVSDDGRRVYFVLDRGLDEPQRGRPHLYVWSAETGAVLIASAFDGLAETSGTAAKVNSLSPDGTKFAFSARARLTDADTRNPACFFDASGGAGDELYGLCRSVYLYDAQTDALRCVSCDPSGSVPGDDARLGGAHPPGDGTTQGIDQQEFGNANYEPRVVDDAGRVFFVSRDRLVPEDADGRYDVYRSDEGRHELLTPGTATDANFSDASADGRDVFFTSGDRLVATDKDNSVDIYDARTAGGLASQDAAPPVPTCVGDACQGTPAAPPAPRASQSERAGTDAPGTSASPARQLLTVKRLTATQRGALASGKAVNVSVRLARAATITTRLTASVGGKAVRFAASTRLGKAGATSISVRLTPAALRQLHRRGTVKATLTVRASGTSAARVQTFTLTAKKKLGN
jgi:sugar lactone lactonase YvrE